MRNDITLVTGCSAGKYERRLRRNWAEWHSGLPWLHDLPAIVYTHGCQADWAKRDGVRVIPWEFPAAGGNMREIMLSAFIFGTARDVHTEAWWKLDGDTRLIDAAFALPLAGEITKRGLIAHRCRRTVTKGEPSDASPYHFLTRLDRWWTLLGLIPIPTEEAFPNLLRNVRIRHRRLAGFCWFEATALTRRIANLCGTRLPVPSQDTTVWYIAHRLGIPWAEINMRQWWRPR